MKLSGQNSRARALDFVNINSVIGSGIDDPEDAVAVASRAVELGFSTNLGIIHDRVGKLVALGARARSVYDRLRQQGKKSYARSPGFAKILPTVNRTTGDVAPELVTSTSAKTGSFT